MDRADGNEAISWTLTSTGDWARYAHAGSTQTRTYSSAHQLIAINMSPLAYDAKGNLASNNLSGATFAWDFDNQLESATIGGTTSTFTYDALGRRVSKTAAGATTIYVSSVYPGGDTDPIGRELAEYALGSAAATPMRNFVFGAAIDEAVLLDNGSAQYYYHVNGLGSIAFLTDSTGGIAECYVYKPFGRETILAPTGTTLGTSAIGNSFLFTGRRLDPETSLYYYRARYYDADLGRFLSRDQWASGNQAHLAASGSRGRQQDLGQMANVFSFVLRGPFWQNYYNSELGSLYRAMRSYSPLSIEGIMPNQCALTDTVGDATIAEMINRQLKGTGPIVDRARRFG